MTRLLLSVLVLAVSAVNAQAQRTLVIEAFDADIRVHADGTIDVVETIRPRFTGPWNGILRNILVQYRTPQGFNYTLWLDVMRVTDLEGTALRYESSRKQHYRKLKIWVPGAADATRTVVLHYRVKNGLRFFDEHDELYWNVTGDEWEVPIEKASARISLPSGVRGIRAAGFTGGYGSRETAAHIDIADALVSVQTMRALGFKEGLTIAVGWEPGLVQRPTVSDRAVDFAYSNSPLLIPVFVFLGMGWLWHTRGRDPRLRPVAPEYEPPAEMTPAEVGTIVDNSSDMRDITATLVDLAVRGYVLIEEHERDRLFGLWSSKDYSFTLRKPRAEWTDLKPHERRLLVAIFRPSAGDEDHIGGPREEELSSVSMSDLENRFYKHLPRIREEIYGRLINRGYYAARPDRVRVAYCIGGLVLGVLVAIGGGIVSVGLGIQPPSAIIAGVLTGVIVCAFGWFMPARTVPGARVLEKALGFEEFLRRVEEDRFQRTIKTPEMFEKYLPFAMALGVEKNWAKAFEGIYTQSPQWYQGTPGSTFQPRAFAAGLGDFSSRASTVMTSAPRSSGGSGFGGGGRSGGGFGGGGGGGF